MIPFYDWILPNKMKYCLSFGDNQAKQKAAEEFVRSLSDKEIFALIICIVIALIGSASYYWWYNEIKWPFGYHYRKRHWFGWLVITCLMAALFTLGICILFLSNMNLEGTGAFVLRLCVANVAYAIVIYGLISVLWCNVLPTNAYRWFKFKK